MTRTVSFGVALDLVHTPMVEVMASAPEAGGAAHLFLGQAGGLVGVVFDLADGDVHLVHRGAGLFGGRRQRLDVLATSRIE